MFKTLKKIALSLTLVLALVVPSFAASTYYNSIKQSNISYGTHVRQVFDIAIPENANGRLIVFVHGGYFLIGDKSSVASINPDYYLNKGFTVASMNYRYLNQAKWPAQINDVSEGLTVIVATMHCEGIEATEITYQGFSAGAIAGALICYADAFKNLNHPKIDKFVGASGLYDPLAVPTNDDMVKLMVSYGFSLLYTYHNRGTKALLIEGYLDNYDATMGYKPTYVYWLNFAHANYLKKQIKATGGVAETKWAATYHTTVYTPDVIKTIEAFIN